MAEPEKPIAVIEGIEVHEDWPDYVLLDDERIPLDQIEGMSDEKLSVLVVEHPRFGRMRPWRHRWGT